MSNWSTSFIFLVCYSRENPHILFLLNRWILVLSPWKLHSWKLCRIRLTTPLGNWPNQDPWKFHTIFSLSPPRGDSTAVLFKLAFGSGIQHGHALSSSMFSVFNPLPPCFHGPVGIFSGWNSSFLTKYRKYPAII